MRKQTKLVAVLSEMCIRDRCAIFYYPDQFIAAGKGWVLNGNPLYCIIALFRSCIYGTALDPFQLGYASLWCIATLIAGTFIFYRKQDKFVLYI